MIFGEGAGILQAFEAWREHSRGKLAGRAPTDNTGADLEKTCRKLRMLRTARTRTR